MNFYEDLIYDSPELILVTVLCVSEKTGYAVLARYRIIYLFIGYLILIFYILIFVLINIVFNIGVLKSY